MTPKAPTNGNSHDPTPFTIPSPIHDESFDAVMTTTFLRQKHQDDSQSLFNDVLEQVRSPSLCVVGNLSKRKCSPTLNSIRLYMVACLQSASLTPHSTLPAQLSAKEDIEIEKESIFSLPSMEFLESILDEMDSRSASAGQNLAEPPLYLPVDSFDLADFGHDDIVDEKQHDPPTKAPRNSGYAASAPGGTVGTTLWAPCEAATRQYPRHLNNSFVLAIPEASSAAPSPVKSGTVAHQIRAALARRSSGGTAAAARHAPDCDEAFDYEDTETSFQTSKSGRMRKVTTFTGNKRKATDMLSQASAPAALACAVGTICTVTQRSDSILSAREEHDPDEVSKKFNNGKRKYSIFMHDTTIPQNL